MLPSNLPRRIPPPDAELAYRFKESTFRLYEPYIAQAITQWPEPVAINPAPLRATTFAARLRDAILRLRLYVTTTSIDLEIFDSVYSQLIVVHTDHTVSIGPRGPKGRAPGAVITTAKTAAGIHWESSSHDNDDIRMAVKLISKRLLVGPLYVPRLTEEFSSELESSYDCAIQHLDDKSIIF